MQPAIVILQTQHSQHLAKHENHASSQPARSTHHPTAQHRVPFERTQPLAQHPPAHPPRQQHTPLALQIHKRTTGEYTIRLTNNKAVMHTHKTARSHCCTQDLLPSSAMMVPSNFVSSAVVPCVAPLLASSCSCYLPNVLQFSCFGHLPRMVEPADGKLLHLNVFLNSTWNRFRISTFFLNGTWISFCTICLETETPK